MISFNNFGVLKSSEGKKTKTKYQLG